MVWRLDRLGRSLPDLVRIVAGLEKRGIGFESITKKIETSSAGGRLVFDVFTSLAAFEHTLIRERSRTGLGPPHVREDALVGENQR